VAADSFGMQAQQMVLVNLIGGLTGGVNNNNNNNNGGYYGYSPLANLSGTLATVKIRNSNDKDLVDFQVRVDALSLKDCLGLKFKIVTESGDEIPYCFERENGECNSAFCDSSDPDCKDPYDTNYWTGNIWIRVPKIPANGELNLIVQPTNSYTKCLMLPVLLNELLIISFEINHRTIFIEFNNSVCKSIDEFSIV